MDGREIPRIKQFISHIIIPLFLYFLTYGYLNSSVCVYRYYTKRTPKYYLLKIIYSTLTGYGTIFISPVEQIYNLLLMTGLYLNIKRYKLILYKIGRTTECILRLNISNNNINYYYCYSQLTLTCKHKGFWTNRDIILYVKLE